MKKYIISILLFALSTSLFAQVAECPIDTVNGRALYRYKVKQSEGLYRICKNFNVSQEEVIQLNPILKSEGLKLGQQLLIPIVERIDSSRYITHQLQPKETLYSISRLYGVSVPSLQQLNPETSKRMTIGSTLLIKEKPTTELIARSLSEAGGNSDVRSHTRGGDVPPIVAHHEHATDSTQSAPSAADDQPDGVGSAIDMTNAIRLAYLLPFNTSSTKRDATMDRFVDFYEGSLLAIYEAQEQGMTFDIVTYDIPKNSSSLGHVLLKHDVRNADALIGPAYPTQIPQAAQFAQGYHVPVLIPFASKVAGIEKNPYLLQFNPMVEQEMHAIINELNGQKDQVHFVFIDTKGNEQTETFKTLHTLLEQTEFSLSHSSINEVLADSLFLALDKNKENILVFNTDKYSAIQVVMDKLTSQKRSYRLSLLSRYSWSEEKCPISMIYASVFQGNGDMTNYNRLRERYFHHDLSAHHPRYDLLGYDLTKCLINNLLQARLSAIDGNTQVTFAQPYAGLQSNIRFEQPEEHAGWTNAQITVIRK